MRGIQIYRGREQRLSVAPSPPSWPVSLHDRRRSGSRSGHASVDGQARHCIRYESPELVRAGPRSARGQCGARKVEVGLGKIRVVCSFPRDSARRRPACFVNPQACLLFLELLDSAKTNLEFSPDLSQTGNAAVGRFLAARDCGTELGRLPLPSATSAPPSLVYRSAAHRAIRSGRLCACDAASRRAQQRASPCSSERSGNAVPRSCWNDRCG